MEEILASIRRIISDDGAEAGGKPEEADREEPRETPGGIEMSATQDDEPAPANGSDDEAEDEPLELTEAVQDDGTVVDLAQQRAAAQAAAAPAQAARVAAPELEPQPTPQPEPEPEPYDSAELELYGEDDLDGDDDDSAQDGAEGEENSMAAAGDIDRDRLVSEATEAATLAALSQLTQPEPQPTGGGIPGGERTLEQVVRDAVSEHLRSWLDANLPTLVERVVREEVRRMARRAEDA
jgi:hypothetical protein